MVALAVFIATIALLGTLIASLISSAALIGIGIMLGKRITAIRHIARCSIGGTRVVLVMKTGLTDTRTATRLCAFAFGFGSLVITAVRLLGIQFFFHNVM